MKQYDEVCRIVNKRTGVMTVVRGWEPSIVAEYIKAEDKYITYAECRDCGNIHKINTDCQVCDLPTKIKPEYNTLLKG